MCHVLLMGFKVVPLITCGDRRAIDYVIEGRGLCTHPGQGHTFLYSEVGKCDSFYVPYTHRRYLKWIVCQAKITFYDNKVLDLRFKRSHNSTKTSSK